MSELLGPCLVCGGGPFEHTPILWPELIAAWELSAAEAAYIDIQQGTHCRTCGSNVRSMALARAIMVVGEFTGTLTEFVADRRQHDLRVLEINEAGSLHPFLRSLPRHQLAAHPDIDMMAMPFPSRAFDLVVHSDTLEHVSDPVKGLEECRRVLDENGAALLTVPVVIGRLSRGRASLAASYHGREGFLDAGMLVHTEFGADVWTFALAAGFTRCELISFHFPAGIAIVARR